MCLVSQSSLISERDMLRQERARVRMELDEVEGELDTLRESIVKLTRQIKVMEQHLNRVCKTCPMDPSLAGQPIVEYTG